jgi:hypothetical protein
MFYLPGLPLWLFVVIAGLTSFACGAVILGFAFAKESVPVQFLGTISGAINVGNMIGPTLLQPAIGWTLDQRWSGQMANGLRVTPSATTRAGLSLIVGWLTLVCPHRDDERDASQTPGVNEPAPLRQGSMDHRRSHTSRAPERRSVSQRCSCACA